MTLSTLLGLGQLAGRSWVVASGHRIDAIRLNVLPCALLAAAFAVGLVAGTHLAGAAAFALLYGGGNGIATITRGAMPLRLFDPAQYGRIVGRLLRPAFLLSAAAPVALAATLEHVGQAGTLGVGLAASVALLVAAGVLTRRHPPPPAGPR
ncbi:hypothetical protein ABXN37_26725 [Piscinibacter sakaiensis]|uniref:hypothetical protein n=1 Tax=Piscinibacter sakaiensis TaxID=1547922 RepID=UPI003726931B